MNLKYVFKEALDSLVGGHRRITKIYRRIREKYHWPVMKNDITEYIRNCQSCQEFELVRIKNKEPTVITDTPLEPFFKIAIDTMGSLPTTPNGKKYILTV